MRNDPDYNKEIETTTPIPREEIACIQKKLGFSYKQDIGELTYVLITCRPDIFYPLIKLSQYSTKLARLYFDTICGIHQYLKDTKDEGIYYWRTKPRHNCPFAPHPTTRADCTNYTPDNEKTTLNADAFNI